MDGRKVEFTLYEDPRPNEGWTKPQLLDFLEKHRKKGRMSRRTGKASLLKAAKAEWDRLDRNFHLHEEATRYALAVLNGEVDDVEPSVAIPEDDQPVFGWLVGTHGPLHAWVTSTQLGMASRRPDRPSQSVKHATLTFSGPTPLYATEAEALAAWKYAQVELLISRLAEAIGSRSGL